MARIFLLCSLVFLLFLAGCSPTPDSLMQQHIALMNDWAAAIESGAPEAKSKEFQARAEALQKQQNELKISDAERQALMKKYQPEMEKVILRLGTATAKQVFGKMGGGK